MCKENKQYLFPIETEKVSTLPYADRGHSVGQQCPVEETSSVRRFLFSAPARQVTRPWQLEGQRAESQGRRHTHTPKHFISITNHSIGNMKGLMQTFLFTVGEESRVALVD